MSPQSRLLQACIGSSARWPGSRTLGALLLATAILAGSQAQARPFRVGEVEGLLNLSASYGVLVRVEDPDRDRILVSESYDAQGRLWRVAEGHVVNHYEVPVPLNTLEVFYDLAARRYYVTGLDNGRNPPRFSEEVDPREFSPNALLYYIR